MANAKDETSIMDHHHNNDNTDPPATTQEQQQAEAQVVEVDPVQMISIRRHGTREHTDAELHTWIQQYTAGQVPDYQMAAWLMAVCFHPLSPRETATLTDAMVQSTPSGPLDWSSVWNHQNQNQNQLPEQNQSKSDAPSSSVPSSPRHLVDKHSTGGVGDKVSILLVPLVASLGVAVPMIAGRGLGHTGGTIDKLESIAGFYTQFSNTTTFQDRVHHVGCTICAAGPSLCLADQKLYALRDVTSTVQSIPLQTASILCKKIAEHPASLVLDVKYGSGAFQETAQEAAELATSMVYTGHGQGLNPTTAFLTQMHQPLGYAIGNWYEIQECLEILQGGDSLQQAQDHCSYDLIALTCLLAGQMLVQSELYPNQSLDELVQLAYDTLQQGKALDKFQEMALAQGADPHQASSLWYPDPHVLYRPHVVRAPCTGRITALHTRQLGLVAVALGAGRQVAQDSVDPHAGILVRCKIGDWVHRGDDVLMELYAPNQSQLQRQVSTLSSTGNSSSGGTLVDQAAACIVITPSNDDDTAAVELQPVVTHVVTLDEGVQDLPPTSLPPLVQDLYQQASNRCNRRRRDDRDGRSSQQQQAEAS